MESMDPIRVSWDWDPDEHGRATAAIKRHRRFWPRVWPSLMWALLGAVVGFGVGSQYRGLSALQLAALVAGCTVGMLVMSGVVDGLKARRVRAVFAKKYGPAARGVSVSVSADGLLIEASDSSLTLAWSAIERAIEAPDHFLFYTGPQSAYFIPRRVCSPGDESGLRAFLPADR
jgi:hypothetical protein